MFKDRSVADIIILSITLTVCIIVIGSGLAIAIIEIVDPDTDTARGTALLSDTVNTLIGVMAGFLAGRTHAKSNGHADVDH